MPPGPTDVVRDLRGLMSGKLRASKAERRKHAVETRAIVTEKSPRQEIGLGESSLFQGLANSRITEGCFAKRMMFTGLLPSPGQDGGQDHERRHDEAPAVASPPADDALEFLLIETFGQLFIHGFLGSPDRGRRSIVDWNESPSALGEDHVVSPEDGPRAREMGETSMTKRSLARPGGKAGGCQTRPWSRIVTSWARPRTIW